MSQHMDALAKAERVRLAGAAFRRQVAAQSQREGSRMIAAALRGGEPAIEPLEAGRLLTSIHRVGDGVARSYLAEACPFATTLPVRRVRELTPVQREQIAALLERVGE